MIDQVAMWVLRFMAWLCLFSGLILGGILLWTAGSMTGADASLGVPGPNQAVSLALIVGAVFGGLIGWAVLHLLAAIYDQLRSH